MIARFLAGSGTTLALILASPALAQTTNSPGAGNSDKAEVELLRNELANLRAQIEALQTRLDTQQATVAKADAISSEAPNKAEAVSKASGGTTVAWKWAPEFSSKDGWTFKPRGRLQYDFGYVDAPDAFTNDGLGFSNELRRVRLGVEGNIPGGFGYRFELEFAGGDAQLWDGYITYKTGGLTLTAGQHNNFQSLDELTSSNDTVLVERAAFTDAFGFERRLGFSGQYNAGPVLLQAGVFTDNVADLDDDGNNSFGLDGRVVFAPKLGAAQLHFAGSAHWRDLGDTVSTVRYRQRPHIHSTDIRFVDTGTLGSAESETSYGFEALAIAGRFHVAGEAHWLDLSRATTPNPRFFGGYAEVGYFLTDSSFGYRSGVFRAPKLASSIGQGGTGAIALSLRYDFLDLNDRGAGVVGGTQNGIIAGLSWWPVENLRLLLNYAHLEYDDAAIVAAGDRSYSVDTIGWRVQVSF
mgnify:FL=1